MGLDMHLYGIKYIDEEKEEGIWKKVAYWRKANQIHKWFSDRYIKQQDPWGIYEVSAIDVQGLLTMCQFLKLLKDKKVELIETEFLKEYSELNDKFNKEIENNDYNIFIQQDMSDIIADILLPPNNLGCFFGSGVVDEDYWNDIDETIKMLTKALDDNYIKFYYIASW